MFRYIKDAGRRALGIGAVLAASILPSGPVFAQVGPGGGGEGCEAYFTWTEAPPASTEAATVPVSLEFGWRGARGSQGQELLCDVESQPDLSVSFQYTVNGVDRTSSFTVSSAGIAVWSATATALLLQAYTINAHVASASSGSLTASTNANPRTLATWEVVGATATKNRNMALCALGCFDAIVAYSTPAYFTRDQPRSATLLYRSGRARPMGIVELETSASGTPAPLYYELRLRRASDNQPVTFTNGQQVLYVQRHAGRQRLTMQFDASALSTGSHDYIAKVTGVWSDATRNADHPVRVLVHNGATSEFGWGWALAGEQRVHAQSDGLVVTDGDGSIAFFAGPPDGTGKYVTPAGDFTVLRTLSQPQSDGATWERAYPDSTKYRFRSDGRLARIVDRFGQATVFNRLNGWQLYQLTDPHGQSLTFTYGSDGKLDYITDPMGRVSYVDIDASGNVSQIRDPESSTSVAFTANYDSFHRIVDRTDRGGNSWKVVYDHASAVAADSTPAVITNGGSTPQRIALRMRSWWAVAIPDWTTGSGNSSSNPGPAIDPDTTWATTTDGEGFVTKYRLDHWGQPLAIVNAVGQQTTITRSGVFPTSITHPTGAIDQFRYEGPNLVYSKPHQRDSVRFRYGSGYAQPDSSWGANRPGQRIFLGAQGRVDSVRVAGSKVTRYHYSSYPFFRLDSLVDNGATTESGSFQRHTTKFRYDYTTGNVDSVLAPAGRWSKTTFDGYGRPETVHALGASRVRTQYDLINRPVKSWTEGWTPADTIVTAYTRTGVAYVRDGRGQVYRDSVNALGWVMRSFDPDSTKLPRVFGYDRNGRVISQTNRRGQTITVSYDGVGRIRSRSGMGVQPDSLSYSADGLQVVGRNAVSRDTLTFNAKGELTSVVKVLATSTPQRYAIAYAYDDRGRRLHHVVSSPSGGPVFVKPIRVYGVDGTLSQLNIQYGTTTLTNGFGYNEEFQRDSTFYSDGTIRSQLYTTNHQVYATGFNRTAIGQAFRRTYARDSLGRIKELRRPSYTSSYDERVKYGYDGKGQLAGTEVIANTPCNQPRDPEYGQVVCGDTTATQIAYDAVANRVSSFGNVGVYGLANRLQSWASTSYTVDDDGNVTGRASPARSYTWDAANRLQCSASGADTTCYDYDAFGQLVRRRSSGAGDRWYLWSDDQLLAELDATGTQRIGEYVYQPGIDAPLALITGATQVAVVRYFEQDEVGNVVGLYGANDSVHQRLTYDPWGVASVTHGALADSSRMRWKGLVWEAPVGLYFVRNRWYDPQLGRFLSEDPIGLAGGINAYVFAYGDPINHGDPSGLTPGANPGDDNGEHDILCSMTGLGCPVGNTSGQAPGSEENPYAPPAGCNEAFSMNGACDDWWMWESAAFDAWEDDSRTPPFAYKRGRFTLTFEDQNGDLHHFYLSDTYWKLRRVKASYKDFAEAVYELRKWTQFGASHPGDVLGSARYVTIRANGGIAPGEEIEYLGGFYQIGSAHGKFIGLRWHVSSSRRR